MRDDAHLFTCNLAFTTSLFLVMMNCEKSETIFIFFAVAFIVCSQFQAIESEHTTVIN